MERVELKSYVGLEVQLVLKDETSVFGVLKCDGTGFSLGNKDEKTYKETDISKVFVLKN